MPDAFPAGHFYSPIPDVDGLDPDRFEAAFRNLVAIDPDEVLDFARRILAYGEELECLVRSGDTDFDWCNSQFPPADAVGYYGMLRELKPTRLIEIGSGYSTLVAAAALRANRRGAITCVEPYPREFLRTMEQVSLIETKVQETPDAPFSELGPGDVLFVDSSHQAKCQSDVLDILFRVLPLLAPGVFIHFHDIFLPDDYPRFWLVEHGIYFNEQYFLAAFLNDNPKYRCRLPLAFLVRHHREQYSRWAQAFHQPGNPCFENLEHGFIKAGSFWIEKIAYQIK